MSTESALLMVHCQVALGLTQKELGALVRRDRRTIQRWQDKGCQLTPDEVEALAAALGPVRPDLVEAVRELGRKWRKAMGASAPATPEVIDAIVAAAAAEIGTAVTKRAVEAALRAAFGKAADAGVELGAVVRGMQWRAGASG